jgi:tetratricopeptide (TPR) repeat protein
MLIRRRIAITAVWWGLAVFMLGGILPAYGQTPTDAERPSLLIKIRDIDQVLQDMESLMPSNPGADAASQTAMIKGMLQGTDWIDPLRSIVAGMQYDGQATSWTVLVPFQTPNENFKGAYGAIAGEDYYVLRFPPAPEMTVSDTEQAYLVQASRQSSDANLIVEMTVHDVVRQSETQIESAIQAMAANAAAGDTPALLTPEEVQGMARDFLATLKQVDTLRVGLNIDPEALLLLLDVKGVPESYLAGLLTDPKTDVRLGGYAPDYPMQFRSRAYNAPGVLQMLGASLGQIYRKMGFDFDELGEIAKGITGEMAGGMALDQKGMTFEMIYALHDRVDGNAYLEEVYLPWFEKYNRRMAALVEAQSGQPLQPLYERMPDTTVAGRKVIGVRTRFPAMTPTGQPSAAAALQDYQTRMTSVDGLILAASTDAAIEKMIQQTGQFQRGTAQGPLAEFSMDLGAYLRGLQHLMPNADPSVTIPPNLGDLSMQAALQEGELTTRTRINVQDMQQLMALFASLSAQAASQTESAAGSAGVQPTATKPPPTAPTPEMVNTPAYWMDRGGLLSAYGNYKGAVRCFQKALDLAPDLVEAHFQQGVAYGEMGQFEAAIGAISRAIDRMPTNGAYFYGRGRVYLLAGDTDLAMKDFMEAGFLGNEDARIYLQHAGVDWN